MSPIKREALPQPGLISCACAQYLDRIEYNRVEPNFDRHEVVLEKIPVRRSFHHFDFRYIHSLNFLLLKEMVA